GRFEGLLRHLVPQAAAEIGVCLHGQFQRVKPRRSANEEALDCAEPGERLFQSDQRRAQPIINLVEAGVIRWNLATRAFQLGARLLEQVLPIKANAEKQPGGPQRGIEPQGLAEGWNSGVKLALQMTGKAEPLPCIRGRMTLMLPLVELFRGGKVAREFCLARRRELLAVRRRYRENQNAGCTQNQ